MYVQYNTYTIKWPTTERRYIPHRDLLPEMLHHTDSGTVCIVLYNGDWAPCFSF